MFLWYYYSSIVICVFLNVFRILLVSTRWICFLFYRVSCRERRLRVQVDRRHYGPGERWNSSDFRSSKHRRNGVASGSVFIVSPPHVFAFLCVARSYVLFMEIENRRRNSRRWSCPGPESCKLSRQIARICSLGDAAAAACNPWAERATVFQPQPSRRVAGISLVIYVNRNDWRGRVCAHVCICVMECEVCTCVRAGTTM